MRTIFAFVAALCLAAHLDRPVLGTAEKQVPDLGGMPSRGVAARRHEGSGPNHAYPTRPWQANMARTPKLFFGPTLAGENDKYLWETPRSVNIDKARTAGMVDELRREVQRVLSAGPLAPLRCSYGDIPGEAYWLYYERGRIITTLAYAYPHVSPHQQAGIRKYVRAALASKSDSPWQPGLKGKAEGAARALNGVAREEGAYFDIKNSPTLHVFYGLWLYGDRTGDWDTLKQYWQQIRQHYINQTAVETVLYGQMSAHIAMARLAKRFNDRDAVAIAEKALQKDFVDGKDVTKIETRQRKTRFGKFAESRNARAFAGQPFMFLDACPEVLRFINDNVREQAAERVRQIEKVYPLWWLAQSPYFTRWTGDESVGTPPELFGICWPVERWVMGTSPEELATYMRSTPTGIGDCYWIEGLVQTIESFGTVQWEKVHPGVKVQTEVVPMPFGVGDRPADSLPGGGPSTGSAAAGKDQPTGAGNQEAPKK